jgi:hypothetical protein
MAKKAQFDVELDELPKKEPKADKLLEISAADYQIRFQTKMTPEDMMRNLNVPVLGEANDRDTILSVDPQTLKVLARKSASKTLDNLVNGDRPTVDPVLPDPVE